MAFASRAARPPASGAFGGPAGRPDARPKFEPPAVSQAKMEVFRKVKPVCVELLGVASTPVTLHSGHAAIIDRLYAVLAGAPKEAFTSSLISYVLFPVTSTIRQSTPSVLPDSYLEAVFRLLARIVAVWKQTGIDPQAWEQLWRFTSAAVGLRIGDKGKGREIGEEAQLQAVELLRALLEPTERHPTDSMRAACGDAKARLMPTLFQTVTLLLETASPSPPHRQLQLASLRLLRTCISTYLGGQYAVLASILPGGISRMARMVHQEGFGVKGEVAKAVIELVQVLVVATLNDEGLRGLKVLQPEVNDLSQLADEWAGHTARDNPSSTSPVNGKVDPFPPLTASYLDFTSSQLYTALPPILSSFADHPAEITRRSLCQLCAQLISRCRDSLPRMVRVCLQILLQLSQDTFQPVQDEARATLHLLTKVADSRLEETLIDLLSDAINTLPRQILSNKDTRVEKTSRLITALAEITAADPKNPIAGLLGPDGRVERWSWSLLECLELARPAGWSATGSHASKAAELGWKASTGLLTNDDDTQGVADFPLLHLRYVEREASARSLQRMFVALGATGGERGLFAVEYFSRFAKNNGKSQVARSVSALWVARALLDGLATRQIDGEDGRVGKTTRKMAREVTKIVIAIDEDEEEEDEETEAPPQVPDESEQGLVEHAKGINAITTLLDKPVRNIHASAETRRLHFQAQRTLRTCLSLSSLALTARILSSGFRPLLLTVLYTVLSHLTSPQPLVSQYADICLSHIAFHSGYASTRNLVLDNVDYVINVVSQRLTYHHLSTSAPLVLIAMIRLVGAEIVPQVHDVVDEIFDALDDYHGYEVLTSSLLAVLVTLMDVMADEIKAEGPSAERLEHLKEWDRIERPPDPQKDFAQLFQWYDQRERDRKEQVQSILERAPQQAFEKDEEEEKPPVDEEPKAPTRSQEVCKAILEKAVNFLSHRSPFLRARILALLARATVVLAAGNREQDLLPYIDRAWSLILLRLDDVPYVVTEAAEVIATLCEETGDFMSRRVLDHAWPQLQKLLERQQVADSHSALARKGAIGTESAFTVSHRLHLAILRVAKFIAAKVPVGGGVLWEMMVLFRPMLDTRVHEEVQALAMEVYLALGSRDGDALWVIISATLGKGGGSTWSWLREENLQVRDNMKRLLQVI